VGYTGSLDTKARGDRFIFLVCRSNFIFMCMAKSFASLIIWLDKIMHLDFRKCKFVLVLNFEDEILIRWVGCDNPHF
jgi:hypothetical protein